MLTLTRTALLSLFLLAAPLGAQDLLLTSRFTDEVLRYDATTGAFKGVFASGLEIDNPVGLSYGPDGNLYVASAPNDSVVRYDGQTGTLLNVFVQGGALDDPRQIQFGPDGNLYVASAGTDEVLRYNGTTGAFLGVFTGASNLNGPNGISFGPGGHLYVAAVLNNRVKYYDGQTGAALGNFAKTNLSFPHDVSFGPDGHLYVTNATAARIARFNGMTGDFIDDFVVDNVLSAALGLLWTPDGDLLVVNQGANEVRRYDGQTGAFDGVLVPPGSGGLSGPLYATTMPLPGGLMLHAPDPGLAGTANHFAVSGAQSGARLLLVLGMNPGSRGVPGCPGSFLDMRDPRLFADVFADEGGNVVVRRDVPQALVGVTIFLQAAHLGRCGMTPLVVFTFP